MSAYYVHNNGAAIFVKEAEFFKSQGGLTEPWGKAWHPIVADSIEDARRKGKGLPKFEMSGADPTGNSEFPGLCPHCGQTVLP